ncbi:MAG: T9SS type A sorting domain-containing protein [Bacteroidota bacterium]
MNPVTVRTQFVDGGLGDSIKFRDPWRVHSDGTQPDLLLSLTSPHHPSGAHNHVDGGVFLDQDPQITPIYYSVGAQSPWMLSGFESYFQNWYAHPDSATLENANALETGVVFKQPGTFVTALFKAHLGSGSTAALINSEQRKIFRGGNGVYYACYESAGHIWITRSTNIGVTWEPEKRVSDDVAGFTNRYPSMSVYLNRLMVTWEVYGFQSPNWVSRIYARSIDYNNIADIQNIYGQPLVQCQYAGQFSSKPVASLRLTTTSSHTVIGYYDPAGAGQIKYYFLSTGGTGVLYDGSAGRPQSFTLTPNPNSNLAQTLSGNRGWAVAWTTGTTLYYRAFGRNDQGQIEMQGIETVSTSPTAIGGISLVYNSQTPNPDIAAVAWFENGDVTLSPATGSNSIKFKQRSPGWAGPVTIWSNVTSNCQPTLTFNHTYNRLALLWEDLGQVKRTDRVNGVWSAVTTLASGYTPSVSIGIPSNYGSANEVVLSRGGTSIYPIQRSTITYSKGLSIYAPVVVPGPQGRGGEFRTNNGSVYVSLLKPTLNSAGISFPHLNDTVTTLKRNEFEDASTTPAFFGQGDLRCMVTYRASGTIPAAFRFQIGLVDASTNEVVATLLTLGGVRDTTFELVAPLEIRRLVKLKMLAPGVPSTARFDLEQWFFPIEESNVKPPAATANRSGLPEEIPTSYALHQNYPNPFNPVTQIRFDLPEANRVAIIVYDVLGKEVATVANGYFETGYHSANFDAASLASGVYLYRLTAGSHIEIRKMVVMR